MTRGSGKVMRQVWWTADTGVKPSHQASPAYCNLLNTGIEHAFGRHGSSQCSNPTSLWLSEGVDWDIESVAHQHSRQGAIPAHRMYQEAPSQDLYGMGIHHRKYTIKVLRQWYMWRMAQICVGLGGLWANYWHPGMHGIFPLTPGVYWTYWVCPIWHKLHDNIYKLWTSYRKLAADLTDWLSWIVRYYCAQFGSSSKVITRRNSEVVLSSGQLEWHAFPIYFLASYLHCNWSCRSVEEKPQINVWIIVDWHLLKPLSAACLSY